MRDLFRFLYRARNTLLFLALMLVAMGMLIDGNTHQRARAISSSNAVVGRIHAWRNSVTSYAGLREVNAMLAARNADLMNRHRGAYAPVENRYVSISDTVHEQRYRYVPAQVINSTTHRQKNFITLDRGTKAGVRAGMGVIGSSGIVGVVRDASPRFAAVISVLNTDLSTSVELRRTGHFGLLVWDTNDPLTASVADIARHVPVQPGDTVITRGGDGVFPRGITVGTVRDVAGDPGSNYHRITVRLAEDLSRSAMAYVVMDLMKLERDSLQAGNVEQP